MRESSCGIRTCAEQIWYIRPQQEIEGNVVKGVQLTDRAQAAP